MITPKKNICALLSLSDKRLHTCDLILLFCVYSYYRIIYKEGVFPGGSSSREICLQCRRPGFDPWVTKIPWKWEWQLIPAFLPGEFHGQRSLAGYSPWGGKVLDTTEQLRHIYLVCIIQTGTKYIFKCSVLRSEVAPHEKISS